MQQYFQSLGPIDVGALIIIAFNVIMGLVRGFVWQLVRLGTIVAALILARTFAGNVAAQLGRIFSVEPPADRILAYFVILFGVFAVGTLLALVLRKMLAAMKLQSYDRLFGAILGGVKGAAIVVVIVLLLSQFRGASALQEALGKSESARLTDVIVERVEPLFPDSVREEFQKWWDEIQSKIPSVPSAPAGGTPGGEGK
ncbi:MAG: CvpA family protein [Planctomycetota bacterium]